MRDRFVQSFVGTPCFRFDTQTCFNMTGCTGRDLSSLYNDPEVQSNSNAEVSWGVNNEFLTEEIESPVDSCDDTSNVMDVSLECNKPVNFNYTLGFVTPPATNFIASNSTPIDMNDCQAYLQLVSDVLSSGLPNYRSVRVPLQSVFNWKYLQQHISSYHDGKLIDYLMFGFPLGIGDRTQIENNATQNHQSALAYECEIDAFFQKELEHKALFGPFEEKPHAAFTWSPLMSRPKGTGRRVILDLSYGENSVNNHTIRDMYDGAPFKLSLPSLDDLLPTLQSLGENARIFKVDISRAFRNVPVDPGDAIHLGMKWRDKFYVDKFLAFGAVHGTAIFQRITDFIRFILAEQGFVVFNYIDDIYACCHFNRAKDAFEALNDVIREVGLPINPQKVFAPTTELSIMGIVINVKRGTFSIEEGKLSEIHELCEQAFLRDYMVKRDFQSLLGKLLYIARCVKASRVFLNRILMAFKAQSAQDRIKLDQGTYESLAWFLQFMKQFNGVVRFNRSAVQHHVYVDASLTGLGGVWGSRVYSTHVPTDVIGERAITQYEMYNILLAVRLWATDFIDRVICVHCDNESAVTVCNTGKTRDPFLDLCLRHLTMVCASFNIDLRVQHIRGKANTVADALSRGKLDQLGEVSWEVVNASLYPVF